MRQADPEGPVVVTGGAGFLGGAVVEQPLAAGVTDLRVVDLVPAAKGKLDRDPPFGPCGQSKPAAERLVEAEKSTTLACAIVCPGLIVGPGRTGVVERVFGRIGRNRPTVMIGNANDRYEVIHVEDVASLVMAPAANGHERV